MRTEARHRKHSFLRYLNKKLKIVVGCTLGRNTENFCAICAGPAEPHPKGYRIALLSVGVIYGK